MKNLWWTLAAVLLGAGAASAQRAVAPRPSLEAFRPVGEYRLWTFIQKDTVLGTIASTVERTVEIGGLRGYALREDFLLDFTKRSGENRFAAAGEHFVGADGAYLGDDLKLNVNGQEGRINVKRKGDVIRGLVGQGRQRREATVTVPSGMFAIDNYMADQFEIYFALRGLTAGETIDDSIFVPRDLLAAPLRGRVTNFSWVQLYKGVFDSVFTVQLDQPVPVELYINRELHLRKLNYRAQDMRVYLDVVREQAELVKPRLTLGALARMIPKYLVFALIGLVGLVLYAGSAVRRLTLWLGALTGAVGFALVALVQLPLQDYLFEALYRPRVAAGSTALPWALLVVLPAGLIQEGLKLLGVVAVGQWRRIPAHYGMATGAAVAAGLGIIEACYLDTVIIDPQLFTWPFLQRVLIILFHATTGALIGQAYFASKRLLWGVLGLAVALNMILRAMPILVQARLMDAGLVNITTGFLVVLLMLGAVVWQRRAA